MVAHVVAKGLARKKGRAPYVASRVNSSTYTAKPKVVEAAPNFKPYMSYAERSRFYTCQDRKTLPESAIRRIRELEELNDGLQREIALHEDELKNAPSDAPFILATIEHKKAMIARNTGEVVKIFISDEERIMRVAELEANIRRLEKEIVEQQQMWNRVHDQESRIRISSVLLLNREKISRHLVELADLKNVA